MWQWCHRRGGDVVVILVVVVMDVEIYESLSCFCRILFILSFIKYFIIT